MSGFEFSQNMTNNIEYFYYAFSDRVYFYLV